MWAKHKHQTGFTIVELLIVIVVIGILAAITIVAYNGVQQKANDAAVQSDLRSFGMQVAQFQAENDRLPALVIQQAPEGVPSIKVSKRAYEKSIHNLYLCRDPDDSSNKFAIAAVSTSGKMYAYYAGEGVKLYTGAWSGSAQICPGLGFPSFVYTYGWNKDSKVWWSWVN